MIFRTKRGRNLWTCRTGWLAFAPVMALGLVSAPLTAQTGQGAVAGAVPIHAMAADADPEFEVATIKPSQPNDPTDGFHTRGRHIFIENQTVNKLVAFAYGLHEKQIAGGPEWLATDRFDIDGVPDIEGTPSLKQQQGMVKRLLAERFMMAFHREKKELSVYAITVGKSGPKLTKSADDLIGLPSQDAEQHGTELAMKFKNMSMTDFGFCMQFFFGQADRGPDRACGEVRLQPQVVVRRDGGKQQSKCCAGIVYGDPGTGRVEAGCGEGAG